MKKYIQCTLKENHAVIMNVESLNNIRCLDKSNWIIKEIDPDDEIDTDEDYHLHVCENAQVSGNAIVTGNALVFGHAKVLEHASVSGGNAQVSDYAVVSGNGEVSEDAHVYGDAIVSGNGKVFGDARVFENGKVFGNAIVTGNARVYGNMCIYDNAYIFGNAEVYGNAEVFGDAQVSGNGSVFRNGKVFGYARVFENGKVFGNARAFGNAIVSSYSELCGEAIATTKTYNIPFLELNVTLTDNHIQIGCKQWTYEQFLCLNEIHIGLEYSQEEYSEMEKAKDLIIDAIKLKRPDLFKKEDKVMKIDLYTYLSLIAYGKSNAILVNDLCNSLGVSRRTIRKLRSENNKKNKVKIITCSKGYFIPNSEDKEEIKKDAYSKIKSGLAQIKEARELFTFYNSNNSLEIDFEKLEIKENKIGGEQDVQ